MEITLQLVIRTSLTALILDPTIREDLRQQIKEFDTNTRVRKQTISVFAILFLVGTAFPVAPNEDHNMAIMDVQSPVKSTSNIVPINDTNISKQTIKLTTMETPHEPLGGDSVANATDVPESATKSVSAISGKTDALLNGTGKNVSVNAKWKQNIRLSKDNVTSAEPTNVINHDVKVDSGKYTSSEQDDLLASRVVMPHDDDDDVIAVTEYSVLPEITVPHIATDHKKNETTTSKISGTTVNPMSKETIHLTNDSIEASHKDKPNETRHTVLLPISTSSTSIQQAQTVHLESKTKSEESGEDGMPASIIALVTAITFGVALAIAYVSMIAWRRYLEYRYGHRELLVNDLEFDTNDLRHFEL